MRSNLLGRGMVLGLSISMASLFGCNGEFFELSNLGAGNAVKGECGVEYLSAVENTASFATDTLEAGATTEIRLDVSYPDDQIDPILKSRRIVVTLPADFVFLGFEALGQGANIGRMDFDFDANGTFEESLFNFTIPFIASGPNSGFTDNRVNGSFDDGIDPTVSHSVGEQGELIFDFVLPEGGANNGSPCHYFPFDGRYTLLSGLLQLPSTPGEYFVEVAATSVDPDTGDQDDEQGTPPITFAKTVPVTVVPEPGTGLLAMSVLYALAALRRRG